MDGLHRLAKIVLESTMRARVRIVSQQAAEATISAS